jgi:GNAT superfamily N-acetyltransferase
MSAEGKPPKAEVPPLEFRRLAADCARGAFVCGDREIDRWFREKALTEHEDLTCRVVTAYVVGRSDRVVGFYAMTIRLQKEIELSQRGAAGVRGQSGQFSSVHLCNVAVHRDLQRQGYGTVIMGAALKDFYEIVVRTGIFAMTLQAANRDLMDFYTKLGFIAFGNSHAIMPKMILSAEAVIEIIEQAD